MLATLHFQKTVHAVRLVELVVGSPAQRRGRVERTTVALPLRGHSSDRGLYPTESESESTVALEVTRFLGRGGSAAGPASGSLESGRAFPFTFFAGTAVRSTSGRECLTENTLTSRRWRRLVVPIRGPREMVVLQDQQVFGHKGPRRRGAGRRVQDVPVVDINLVKNFGQVEPASEILRPLDQLGDVFL